MEGKYVIIDLVSMDFMKDEQGVIKCYENANAANLIAGLYEFDNVWVCKLVNNVIKEPRMMVEADWLDVGIKPEEVKEVDEVKVGLLSFESKQARRQQKREAWADLDSQFKHLLDVACKDYLETVRRIDESPRWIQLRIKDEDWCMLRFKNSQGKGPMHTLSLPEPLSKVSFNHFYEHFKGVKYEFINKYYPQITEGGTQ